MEQKSTFGLALKPGLIIIAATTVFSLLVWSLTSDLEMQKYLGWFSYAIVAFGFYYFTVNYRDNVKGGHISYGEGFIFMFFMSIVYSFGFGIYYYLFLTFIDPEMTDKMMVMVEQEYYNQGLTEEQIEAALGFVSYMFKPWLLSLMAVFGGLISGVITSLVIAIFTKKEASLNFDN
ncbi:MAG: DUF4199 domain-containing protein [Bacteroidales bacterium]|nr:DUF4199 domain-containing protein [Bacteroidales bacterium]